MKKILTLLVCGMMIVSLAACQSTTKEEGTGTYTAGNYSGTAKGFGGDVTVTITTSTTAITDVVIEGNDETPEVGGAAFEELATQILDAQSDEIDGVSGATMTSNGVKAATLSAINAAKGVATTEKTPLQDGAYETKATSYSWTGMLSANVTITAGKIEKIDVTEEHDSETGEMAATALELMGPRIIESQSLATDAISGATSTSNAIKDCVAQAIELAGGKASEWQTEVTKSSETVTLEGYDVIVVGLGGSGILSYVAAADAGATVFGIETTAKLGGQSATTTGPMIINSKNPVYADVTFVNPDDLYATWIDYVGSEDKADIIHEAAYNSGERIDYYVDNFGFEFDGMIMSFAKPEWQQLWTRYVGEDGKSNIFGPQKTNQYDRAMEKAVAMNEKNDYKLELTAQELIMEDGVVKGVKAVSYDGTTYEIYGDTVILATGGYIGSEEMMLEAFGTTVNTVASTVNDGTGIKMGESAGGATYMMGVDPMIHILQVPNMIKNDDLTANQKAILSALALVKGEKEVTVDGDLLDQTLPDSSYPGYRAYVVYSEDQINQFKESGLTENFENATSMFMGQGGTFEVGKPVEDIDTILSVGAEYNDVLKADSIADLATQIGCDEAKLSESLGGVDTTYYAVIVSCYAYGTVGGLDVDINMNVLKEDGTPIENLFAVGQDSMGVENVEGKPYTPWGGQAQAWTFTSGYLAGNAAATYGLSK